MCGTGTHALHGFCGGEHDAVGGGRVFISFIFIFKFTACMTVSSSGVDGGWANGGTGFMAEY